MASTPQRLSTASQCYECIPPGLQLGVLIYEFAIIAGMATDPQTLMTAAKCMECIPQGQQMPVLISLADKIASGGTGSSCLLCGSVDPVAIPACTCAIYYRPDTGKFWYWDGVGLAWTPFIA